MIANTLDRLRTGAEVVIHRPRADRPYRATHGAVIAEVWVESADGRRAWPERRVVLLTVATYPDEYRAARAMAALVGRR